MKGDGSAALGAGVFLVSAAVAAGVALLVSRALKPAPEPGWQPDDAPPRVDVGYDGPPYGVPGTPTSTI